ncbi:phosphatidylinositol N-acetylglucosaminyltransferase subunit Y [Entomortierella parvispora]|uniref:Phosphatidylinositol N-acetylglucosaminyltransferase subunit Y n=1 Tax=Entomortierella parvispora TaxID=205924 RepID=A0A9P3HHZ7_9FUNG|nr:phosphatidylinositol N-acetylglucosaminyltransferase subunit Y [Entomortierella parvispora]
MPSTTDQPAASDAEGPHPLDGPPASSSSAQSPHRKQPPHQPSPLNIALPLTSRSVSNGAAYSAGYLEHRRDTFHSLPSSVSMQYHHSNGFSSNHIGPNSNNGPLWPTHQQHASHDLNSSPFSLSSTLHNTNHNSRSQQALASRPQSLSYAHSSSHHQHHRTPSDLEGLLLRRRRVSSTSSSSKLPQLNGDSRGLRGVDSGATGGATINNTSFSSSTASTPNVHRSKAPNTPHHTRRFTTLISDQEPDTTYLWGYLLFFSTMVGFTISMYALVASNYMPMTGNKTLDWIKQDSHYCMLVPVTIPVTVLAVLFNWLGMKLFRHN